MAYEESWPISWIKNPSEELQLVVININPYNISYIVNPTEKVQLAALESSWTKHFYEEYIKGLPNKTDWFNKEFNRLKLIKGPLK